ncbi:MAG: acetyltransferase [Ruminococcaceae bacterium]|nr:acetyltransferase [Oscillospiraceae bacterium]
MHKNVILIGGGGHAKVVMDIVEACGDRVRGILDDVLPVGAQVQGVPVLGTTADAVRFEDAQFVIAVGSNEVRKKLAARLDAAWYTAIHPSAIVSERAVIGEGSVVMPRAVINSGARIGQHCVINTAAVVEHDNRIDDYAHVSCGAVLTGTVHVGEAALVGAGAIVRNNVTICAEAIVGAGAVVTADITEKGTYVGVPARKLV